MFYDSWQQNARIFTLPKKPAGIMVMLLVATFLILLLPGGQVSAALHSGCTAYAFSPDHTLLDFPSSSFVSGTRPFFSESTCTTETGETISAGRGCVYADTEDEAKSVCQSKVGSGSEATRLWDLYPEYQTANQKLWKCSASAGGNGSKRKATKRKPVYIPPTGVSLNKTDLSVTAVHGLNSGIECQRVDNAGVGIQWVIDLGVLDAVDVWSFVGLGYEVCFPQSGRIIFLDAAASPRTVLTDISYELRDGYTCAAMKIAGTLVLVPADSLEITPDTSSLGITSAKVDSSGEDISWANDLTNCQVTTDFNLRLRRQPGGESLRLVPRNTTLAATRRTVYWFKVEFNNIDGWIAASLTTTAGDCAPNGDSADVIAAATVGAARD